MFHKYASPAQFMRLAARLTPWAGGLAILLFAIGVPWALFYSPPDYQQGEAVRIMYVHVPAAWMALMVYGIMATASACYLVWKHPVASIVATVSALPGAGFALLTLITGSLWGKPMWGAWWVWDARLTSMLILFFLYVGYIVLEDAFDDEERGRFSCAVLNLIGAVNLPIIKFSVNWWNTLHQPASILRLGGPSIHASMLMPLLVMIAAFFMFYITLLLIRARSAILLHKLQRLG